MKSRLLSVVLAVVIWLVATAPAWAWIPETPEDFYYLGVLGSGQTAVLEGDFEGNHVVVWVQAANEWITFVRVYWMSSRGDGGSPLIYFDGQGTGDRIAPYLFFACYPVSCRIGEVALYAPEGWVRTQ